MSRDALVIGINTYSYQGLKPLQAPAQDAEAVAQLLEKYGDFKVTRLPAVKNKENNTIRVGKQTKIAQTDLKKAIVQLFKPEGHPPDTALLYFSGHGLREAVGIEEGYLATSDVNPPLGNWGLSLQWLRRLLQESPVRQQIVILDCCYSGEVLNFTEADPGDRGKGRDRCFIAASRAFEVAYEEIGNQHSVLTSALLKGLEPKAEQWVTNYTLIDVVSQQKNSFPQRPIFTNSGEPIQLTRRLTASVSESRVISQQTTCPYKGLAYFDCTPEDAKYFYGRTALTDELLEKVRVGNFLAVLGASGSGKSSVVRAGLLYELKQGRRLSGSDNWQIKIFRPGENPLQNLALTFVDEGLSDVKRASELGEAEKSLRQQGADGLRQLIDVAKTQRVVLVADQFEEAFTLCQDIEVRKKFFECLLSALQRKDNKLCLVLTMRADFFGKCAEQEYSGLLRHIQENLVTVTPMSEPELREAIIKPAQLVGLEVEPQLVERILEDVNNAPGYLPLLEYTLTELWKKQSDNCLRVNSYLKLGGVSKTLEKRANEVYDSLFEQEQKAAEYIFLELTQIGEGTEDTRRRVSRQELITNQFSEDLIDRVIQKLTNEKLIITSTLTEVKPESNKPEIVIVIDVIHETLIRNWEKLRNWINNNKKKLIENRKIKVYLEIDAQTQEKAESIKSFEKIIELHEQWEKNDENENYLLKGTWLLDAERLLQNDYKSRLSDKCIEFINKSIEDNKQREKDRQTKFPQKNILISTLFILFVMWIGHVSGSTAMSKKAEESQAKLEELQAKGEQIQKFIRILIERSRANLSGVDLSGVDLSGVDLSGANLSGANLNGTNLSGANLNGTNFSGANLNGTNFSGVDLSGADLSNTDLYKIRVTNTTKCNVKTKFPKQYIDSDRPIHGNKCSMPSR